MAHWQLFRLHRTFETLLFTNTKSGVWREGMVHWGFVYKEKGTLCRYKHFVVVEAMLVGWWGWLGLNCGVEKRKKTFKDDSR